MKDLTVSIRRFDPDKDKEPYFQTYTVKVNDGARVLHVLHAIHDTLDPTLSYRYSCASGQCGSCAVRVNGEPVLACMEEARDGMTIEPINLPGEKGPRCRSPAETGADRLVPAEKGDHASRKSRTSMRSSPCGTASNASAASRSALPWT